MQEEKKRQATVMIVILATQLNNWLSFTVTQKGFRQQSKQRANLLIKNIDNFLSELKKAVGDDFLFEESAEFSDMIETILNLNENDRKRVGGLIVKLLKEK